MEAVGAPSLLPLGLDLRVLRKVRPHEATWVALSLAANESHLGPPQGHFNRNLWYKTGMRWIQFQVSPAGWLLTSFIHWTNEHWHRCYGGTGKRVGSALTVVYSATERKKKTWTSFSKWDCKPEPCWTLCLHYLISSNLLLVPVGRHQILRNAVAQD